MNRRLATLLVLLGLAISPTMVLAQEDPVWALKFDGASDFVKLGTNGSMLGPNWPATKSASLWVKPTGTATCTGPEPGTCDAIFGDRPRTWGISRGTLGGLDRIWVWNYDGTFDRIGIEYTVGEWVEIALVHDGGLLSAYKNGALVGSVSSGATTQAATSPVLHVGGIINNASKNWTFEGEIDELQLWNVARSASEILDGSSHGLTGSEAGLAAYYKMSDGSGTLLTDDSGHGWTGTLTDGGSGVPADGPIQWVESGAFGANSVPPTPNTAPTADSQSVSTLEDTPVPIALTGSDADGDPITFRIVTPPAYGALSGTLPNVTYTPVSNFNGPDSFTFVVNDGRVDSSAATVTLSVSPVNDPPLAAADTVTTTADTPVVAAVLANDVDVDGDALSITAVSTPENGSVAFDSAQITYTPNAGFTGTDTFSYTMTDPFGETASASVTVTVRPPGPDPGYALRFDGVSDYVSLAATANMLGPGWQTTKTVSLWVRPTGNPYCNAPSPASCDAIFGDRPRWWGISQGVINGLDRLWVWNYDGNYDVIAVPYTAGDWVHISMVHAGGMLSAYKNGVLVGSVPSGATQQPFTGALPILHFGGIINTTSRNWTFKGEIDELQLWNIARTAEQIDSDMRGPLAGSEIGLAAYYQMTDGAGVWLTDNTGHGWTGELHDGGQGVPADGPIAWVTSGAFVIIQ